MTEILLFAESLEFLTTAAINFEKSIGKQVVSLFRMFDKEEDGGLERKEVKKAITLLEDLLRVFKRVDKVFDPVEGARQLEADKNAPLPEDGILYVKGG